MCVAVLQVCSDMPRAHSTAATRRHDQLHVLQCAMQCVLQGVGGEGRAAKSTYICCVCIQYCKNVAHLTCMCFAVGMCYRECVLIPSVAAARRHEQGQFELDVSQCVLQCEIGRAHV